uniref:Uncharacterized protein n=1 Tax=Oncorhynchus kisutch TaxID=8019 RepID=A0A8C7LYI7_ONCKI
MDNIQLAGFSVHQPDTTATLGKTRGGGLSLFVSNSWCAISNIKEVSARSGGNGYKWNYTLLMPMIDLPAFRKYWSHRGRSDKCFQAIRDDIELKYKETLRENRQKAVHLEKEKDRVQGYRQAIASQSQQLMEECRRLSQEQESLTGEKSQRYGPLPHGSGEGERVALRGCGCSEGGEGGSGEETGGLLQHPGVLGEEAGNGDGRAGREQALAQLDMEAGFKDIFKNDLHCAQYWQLQVTLQKHRRAEATLLETQSSNL